MICDKCREMHGDSIIDAESEKTAIKSRIRNRVMSGDYAVFMDEYDRVSSMVRACECFFEEGVRCDYMTALWDILCFSEDMLNRFKDIKSRSHLLLWLMAECEMSKG